MDGTGGHGRAYAFGSFTVDELSRTIKREGAEIHLAQRPFDILVNLIENRERVVSRAELLDEYWDGHEVYDDALRKCVGSIRKAINDTAKPPRFIETRYGGGYRFIADVEIFNGNGNSSSNGHKASLNLETDTRRAGATKLSGFYQSFRPIAAAAVVLILAILTLGFYVFVPRQQNSVSASEPGDPLTRIRAIAVMPLKNLTGKPENEYFSDGVTDSIITELARSKQLKVISRGSTFSFKGKEMDPREIGTQLGVDALLEGTVQSKGDSVNIRVRLVDTRDGRILWTSNDFEREFSAAYDLQDTIACNVAGELRTELCGSSPNKKTHSGLAYQEYLKGRYEWNKRNAAGIKKSIEHYNRAIAVDPEYALAYSGLSESYLQGIWHVPFASADALPRAREMGLKAVSLDDSLAEAHTALAGVYSLEWKWADSEREIRRAIELNPRYARAFHSLAFSLMIHGRAEESIVAIDRAAELDPLNMVISTDKGNLLHAAGRTEDAFHQWNETLERDPGFTMSRVHRLIGFETVGNDAGALEDYLAIMKLDGATTEKISAARDIGTRFGFKEIRRREYREFVVRLKKGERISPVTIANDCSRLGMIDEAFAWLEKAYKERDAQMVLIVSPQFSAIQTDPRYAEMLKRIGLTE